MPRLDHFSKHHLKSLTEKVKRNLFSVSWEYTMTVKIFKNARKMVWMGGNWSGRGANIYASPCNRFLAKIINVRCNGTTIQATLVLTRLTSFKTDGTLCRTTYFRFMVLRTIVGMHNKKSTLVSIQNSLEISHL